MDDTWKNLPEWQAIRRLIRNYYQDVGKPPMSNREVEDFLEDARICAYIKLSYDMGRSIEDIAAYTNNHVQGVRFVLVRDWTDDPVLVAAYNAIKDEML